MNRYAESLEDLRAARAVATKLGDERLEADCLLDEAIVLDWSDEISEEKRRMEQAAALVERAGDRGLEAQWLMAQGRVRLHEERPDEAIESLERSLGRAAEVGDQETYVIALLLLSVALVMRGRLDAARRRFEEVIAACEEAGDRFHLCAAYTNRLWLWESLGEPDRGIEDLRCAVQLAREVGHSVSEARATYNLAENLFRGGDQEESLPLARRARQLQEQALENVAPFETLLLARIHAARDEDDEAARHLVAVHPSGDESPAIALTRRALELLLAEAECAKPDQSGATAWQRLVEEARDALAAPDYLEVLYWRGRAALRAHQRAEVERIVRQAEEAGLDEQPIWRRRFDELAGQPASG